MLIVLYSAIILLLAAIPAGMIARNLPLFERPKDADSEDVSGGVSVLIPARNEEIGIAAAVNSVLANDLAALEVIVLDDASEDNTAAIVREIADSDERIRLEQSAVLPDGWNGKQHACWQLANAATYDRLLFLDADVIMGPTAVRTCAVELERRGVDLLSGFPKQRMETWSEQWLIPMMYYLLLGYLPLDRMRKTTQPEFGAGCGQLFLAKRQSYFEANGHRAIQNSRHDGLKLPRSFRSAGFKTDLFDATELADVRMYRGLSEVIPGVLKNATEGIANAKLIWLFTILLIGGSVLPIVSLIVGLASGWYEQSMTGLLAVLMLASATLLSFVGRFQIAYQLGQSLQAALWQPLAVGWFVCLQWVAFVRAAAGKTPTPWRGRT